MTFKETEHIIDGMTIRHISEHKYLVLSKTDPSKIYEINLEDKDNPHPDCIGFYHRQTCSHMRAIQGLIQGNE